MSTAPKELREVDLTAKMSKSKKKKLKKRAKRNQQLMDETMQHIVEKETSGGGDVDASAGAAAVAAAVVMASPGKGKDATPPATDSKLAPKGTSQENWSEWLISKFWVNVLKFFFFISVMIF